MRHFIKNPHLTALLMAVIFGVAIAGATYVSASTPAQVADITDPWVDRQVIDNCQQIEIYENQSTSVVEYRESDICLDVVIETRDATVVESASYEFQRDTRIQEKAEQDALASLQDDPETGQNHNQWVSNHTAQSQSCVDDMDTGLAGNAFNDLGVNAQNLTIERIMECVRHAEHVNTKMLPNLYNLLVSRGILDVTGE